MSTDQDPETLGDEKLNEGAITSIQGSLRHDEEVVAVAGFDLERKVAAVTSQRILIGEEGKRTPKSCGYSQVGQIRRDGCTLVITTTQGQEDRYHMGADQTVMGLVRNA